MYKAVLTFDKETPATSHALSGVPSGLREGEVLILVVSSGPASPSATPSGWTKVYDQGSVYEKIIVYAKHASDADESSLSVTITFASAQPLAGILYRIAGEVDVTSIVVSDEGYSANGATATWGALAAPSSDAYWLGFSTTGGLSIHGSYPTDLTLGRSKVGITTPSPDTFDYELACAWAPWGGLPADVSWPVSPSGRWTAGGLYILQYRPMSRHFLVAQAILNTLKADSVVTSVIPAGRWKIQKKAWHRGQQWAAGAYVVPVRRMEPAFENKVLKITCPVLVAAVFSGADRDLTASMRIRMGLAERIEDIFAWKGKSEAPGFLTDLTTAIEGEEKFVYEKVFTQPGDPFMSGAFEQGYDAEAVLVNVDIIRNKVDYSGLA